ncbi:MAG: DegV domain-containing protein [Chloroflexota bacterium]|nr:DegV family protein [Anaerolineales bacterium]GIK43603.1 MAG: DegV domain-containing protein [Chloroflexota bacterium]
MSRKVAIITDSTAYLEPGEAEKLGVHVIPVTIQLGNDRFLEGINIDSDELFRRLNYGAPYPASLPPDPAVFEELYTRLHKQTDQMLSIHISSHLSKTLQQARFGAESLLGRCTIELVDSMTTSVGLGILVKAAARAANDGATLDDIVRLVRGMIPHIYLVFYVETMDYLERSGRIGKAQAILGSMLNIKPILFMEDGDIIPLEKVRTTEKAIEKLFEFVAEFDNLEQTAIIQPNKQPNKEAKTLKERLEQSFPSLRFPIIQYGPDLATRVGPNAMGIVVYEGMTF